MSKDMRSINRSEGYEVVAMPVSVSELSFGNGVDAASTPKNKNGGRLSFGSEIVGAVKEQLTTTPKSKNVSNLSFGSEVIAGVKDQLTPTPKSKIGGLGLGSEAIAAAKYHNAKSKNAGVDQDWEVVELRSSTDLTIPHRPSIPRKPVIDLEDYEVLSPLTGTTSNTTIPHTIIDDSDSEAEFEFEIISSHTLTPLPRRRSTIYPLRNPPIQHPHYSLTSTTISNLALSPSTVVELSDGDFLKITDLIRNVDTAEITLRGHRFQRTRDLNGLLAKKRNELCWVTEVDEDDDRPAAIQSLAEVPATSVTRVRTALITNTSFPAATFRNTPHPGNLENVENEGLVTVRWKYTTTWPSAKERVNNENAFCERVLRHLGEGDKLVGEGLRIKDELAREKFRGPTVLGGSYVPVVRRGGNGGVKRGDSKLPVRLEESGWLRRLPGSRSGSVLQIGGLAQAAGQAQTAGRFDDDMVDLTDELPKTGMKPRPSVAEATQERMLSQIDLTTPDLSLPPSEGMVRAINAASMKKTTIKRVEGQMYTYGDACKSPSPPIPKQPPTNPPPSLRSRRRNPRRPHGRPQSDVGLRLQLPRLRDVAPKLPLSDHVRDVRLRRVRPMGQGSQSRQAQPRTSGHPAHLSSLPVFLAGAHDCGER